MTDNKKKKPEAPKELIENITEASKNARKIYTLYIGLLAYCALTIVSTTDRQLILNEPARLPVINVEVPLEGFFILSPFLMIFFFAYFQLYLHKLKRLFDELRDNYTTIEGYKIYPWLINFVDEVKSSFIGRAQQFIVDFSLWWAMPTVLMLNALWYVKKHSLFIDILLNLMVIMGIVIVIIFWNLYREVNGIKKKMKLSKRFSEFLNIYVYPRKRIILILIGFEVIMIFLIMFSFSGKVEFLRDQIYVDLSYQKLITEQNEKYATLYWVDLQKVHLEGANLTGAILKRADLRRANLKNANLLNANLVGAYLSSVCLDSANLLVANLDSAIIRGAHLKGAILRGAHLKGAILDRAHLEGAILDGAHLEGADLRDAHLEGAILGGTRLDSAYLSRAHLEGANLFGANLEGANLSSARLDTANLMFVHLEGAILDGAHLEGAILDGAHLEGADLDGAHLEGADLGGTRLDSAYLSRAHLEGAWLSGAHLEGANLRRADCKGAVFDNTSLKKTNLSYANIEQLQSWGSIKDMSGANIFGIKNAPEGFIEFAKSKGAIEIHPDSLR